MPNSSASADRTSTGGSAAGERLKRCALLMAIVLLTPLGFLFMAAGWLFEMCAYWFVAGQHYYDKFHEAVAAIPRTPATPSQDQQDA